VDNLKVAQFLYLIINNKEIRDVIDTIRSKVVLILGRFDNKNKPRLNRIREVLSSLRDEKGEQRYIPVMFDFEKPESTNFMEPVVTLAHMSRFIIADFTDPKVVLAELHAIYGPAKIPLLPLLRQTPGEDVIEPIPLPDIRHNNRWIMATHRFANDDDLLKEVSALADRAEKHRRRVEREIARSNEDYEDED